MRHSLLAAALGLVVACQSKGAPPAEGNTAPAQPDPGPARPSAPIEGHLVSQATVERLLAAGSREQWFGLYINGKKIGFASIGLRPTGKGEPGGLVWSVSARLRTGTGTDTADADLEEQRFYQRAAPHRLLEVRSRERGGQSQVDRVYRRDGDELVAGQTIDGAAQPERRVAGSAETLLSVLDQQAVEPGEVRAGMSATVHEFETDAERDKVTAVKVVEVVKQRVSGVDTQVAVLSTQSEGEQSISRSVIASGAVVLSASLGGGIDLRWEEKEQAQSNVAGFDIIADAVRVDRPLGEPSAVRELHLRVAVPGNLMLRDAPNQELTRRKDGALDVSLFSRPGLPVMSSERRAALATSASVDAGHPAVAQLARELTDGESDPARRVERLVDWIYRNLDKDLSTNLTTASQVLAVRQGDCTEHALLFVALARAAGIPAREVSGLVYMGDAIQRFGWHAWAEVDIAGRWVQVDPSWGEPLANATHLTLGVGDDSDWVTALGGLQIQLREP